MEKKSRRKFSAEFKTKVVLEVLKERSTIEQLARKYELHPLKLITGKGVPNQCVNRFCIRFRKVRRKARSGEKKWKNFMPRSAS